MCLSVCDRVQPVVGTASRDHGGDKGEVLLVYLLVNISRIVYLQFVLGIYTLPGRWRRRIIYTKTYTNVHNLPPRGAPWFPCASLTGAPVHNICNCVYKNKHIYTQPPSARRVQHILAKDLGHTFNNQPPTLRHGHRTGKHACASPSKR